MAQITNQLLKDAIADAEAVRQTAIANAKIALEETFTPQIKSMLVKRLRAEAMEEGEASEAAKEQPFQDATHVSGGGPEDTSGIGTTDNKEPSTAANDSSGIDQGGEGESDSSTDWYDDWSESDFDLDEIIKELEEDVQALSEKKEEEEEEELDESKHEEEEEELDESWSEEEEGAENLPAASPAGMHKGEVPAQSSGIGKEVAMDAHASDVNKFVTNPSVPKHETHGMAPEMGHGEGHGEEEELDLEAILRELEAEEETEKHDSEEMAHKVDALQKELAEYRTVVNVLRGKLQEVNLLNAKLLFTNKLFGNKTLTNEQKVAIVENFDRATTVREVKIVYTTLVETLNTAAKAMKRPTNAAKVVTEGLASKATPSTAPKAEILEENTLAKRLQQLAGIL